MKDDGLYLLHVAECIERIQRYTAGGKDVFWTDTLIQDAVLRNLQTLAESSQRVSAAMKAKRPDVDWKAIAGFRNILVHDYLGVDLEEVWNIVMRDIPALKAAVAALSAEAGVPPVPPQQP